MKAAPRVKADIRLPIFFPCSNRKQSYWYPGGYFKMRKQHELLRIWGLEICWKIFSNLYFHYSTTCENPICFPHYTFSAYRWEDIFRQEKNLCPTGNPVNRGLAMRKMGLEPTRHECHKILSLARLPVPTLPHTVFGSWSLPLGADHMTYNTI